MTNLDIACNRIVNVIKKHDEFKNHVFAVGGYVRDKVMGITPKDLDLVVDIYNGNKIFANLIRQEYPEVTTTPIPLGAYPIRQIQFTDINEIIEIADTMSEEFPDIYSRQRQVKFASLIEDIYRRDFTINSMLIDLSTNELIDLVHGKDDINRKVINCNPNSNPEEIFSADPLRIIRAIRFAVKYNFLISDNVQQAIKEIGERITILSNERIYAELKNICNVKLGLYHAIQLMEKFDILKYIFPEVDHLKTIRQAPDSRLIHLEGSKFTCKNYSKKGD